MKLVASEDNQFVRAVLFDGLAADGVGNLRGRTRRAGIAVRRRLGLSVRGVSIGVIGVAVGFVIFNKVNPNQWLASDFTVGLPTPPTTDQEESR
ncbi:hypothetical protein [Haloarcula sp. JP-L23]|uniref:hypothetical protein n=1 Tax=Haloarcula sp. JP-L23 TaxID=2716717 RepID=UPI00140EF8A9|nr:hypothetical protein G9465_23660 [Haloarcula sp. JP-L23]